MLLDVMMDQLAGILNHKLIKLIHCFSITLTVTTIRLTSSMHVKVPRWLLSVLAQVGSQGGIYWGGGGLLVS